MRINYQISLVRWWVSLHGQPHKIFNFLCTDPVCQQRGVRVIGVAYHQVFSQRKVTPYFRRERKNKQNLNEHHEECEWFLDDAYYSYDGIHQGETEQQAKIRRELHNKTNNIIELYDPIPKIEQQQISDALTGEPVINSSLLRERQNNNNEQEKRRTRNSTTVFYKVANYHHFLSENFMIDDFKQIKLFVVGVGETTWFRYFKTLNFINKIQEQSIFYSSLTKIKKYGSGFKLFFKAKLDGRSVSLYISKEQVAAYKHKAHLIDLLQNVPDDQFLSDDIRAYFVHSEISLNQYDKYDLIVNDLSKLAITFNSDKSKI
ncbi:Uncharacterised protein [Oligella urethralis]|uniref:hypothetical protein n=1 Tax=Oligella urethralis TaxID=90245 RepID=UPI000DFAC106|nr:hypothetical protein [Oligella urethralis]SUA61583.1 Uncharacterised protein [Oligella urethralis]